MNDRLDNWQSVSCWSGYHLQCSTGKCRCACHQPKEQKR